MPLFFGSLPGGNSGSSPLLPEREVRRLPCDVASSRNVAEVTADEAGDATQTAPIGVKPVTTYERAQCRSVRAQCKQLTRQQWLRYNQVKGSLTRC